MVVQLIHGIHKTINYKEVGQIKAFIPSFKFKRAQFRDLVNECNLVHQKLGVKLLSVIATLRGPIHSTTLITLLINKVDDR